MAIFYSDDLKYLARVLEGLSLIYPESDDNSLIAKVDVRQASGSPHVASKVQSLGRVRYKGDSTWDFMTHDATYDITPASALTEFDIFSLKMSSSAKAYIKKVKEDIDYIGTTMGLYVHVSLLDAFNDEKEVGYIHNRSGIAQYYSSV